jgi:hypothetical protein
MRTWNIGGCCGLLVALPWLAVLIRQSEDDNWHSIQFWLAIALMNLPFLANALLAVFLHKKRHTSVWLMILPALFLIPTFEGHPKSITYALPAGMIWLAGCFALFAVERCEPQRSTSTTNPQTESKLS